MPNKVLKKKMWPLQQFGPNFPLKCSRQVDNKGKYSKHHQNAFYIHGVMFKATTNIGACIIKLK